MVSDSLAHTKLTQLRTQDSDSLAHTKASHLYTALAVQQTQALLFHDQLPVCWGGVGWGEVVITFMFLCTHRHSNLIIFLAVQQTQALLFHDQLPVGWGGVGWGGVG